MCISGCDDHHHSDSRWHNNWMNEMIRITVSGKTYPMRQRLKDNGFWWDSKSETWNRIVSEATLDNTLDDIRPPVSFSTRPTLQIFVTLQSVDVRGNPFNNRTFRLKLLELERPGVSILEEFRKELSDIFVSHVPGPSNPEKEPRGENDEL